MSKKKVALIASGLLVGLIIIGSVAGGGDSKKSGSATADSQTTTKAADDTAEPKAGPKMQGAVKKSILITGDDEANSRVKIQQTWCRWNDGEVEVHALIKNPMAAHITVHLTTGYSLADAGKHGDGIADVHDIGVNAKEWRNWSTKMGTPDGVTGTPAITACSPELQGIDLG